MAIGGMRCSLPLVGAPLEPSLEFIPILPSEKQAALVSISLAIQAIFDIVPGSRWFVTAGSFNERVFQGLDFVVAQVSTMEG